MHIAPAIYTGVAGTVCPVVEIFSLDSPPGFDVVVKGYVLFPFDGRPSSCYAADELDTARLEADNNQQPTP